MLRGLFYVGAICLGSIALFAQSFDVASIKPAAPMEGELIRVGARGGPGTPDPGQMTFVNMSLSGLIQSAYDVKDFQVTGPDWLQSTRFDISAKVPAGATKEQSRLMLQRLLADRFKLVLHHSTKEASVYALLVAKNGPKLKEWVDSNATPPGASNAATGRAETIGKDGMPQLPPDAPKGSTAMMMAPGGRLARIVAVGTTVKGLLGPLEMQLDRPVVDMTGLTGTYDITLDFAPDPAVMQAKMAASGMTRPPGPAPETGGGPAGSAQDPSGAATIFSALPEQLGLRLEARKAPVDLLVIDSVQKTPTEN